jgi:tape measure domain-containing protein
MRPVEIEFLMKDRLSGGIDNARMKSDLLDASLKRMAATVGTAFSLKKAIEFGKVMMDVRGQIESFQISFETLIGSKDKAGAFFSELKNMSAKTPLALDDLAKASQTLIGFGVDSERVIPILRQIGDVTMGNKERFGAMSLAFSQMFAAGKLMGQDLLQMINAGFNPLMTISEQTGKSISRLRDEMSDGAISAEMVAQAFADVTSEGGKFNGMLEKQSEGWNGMKAQFNAAVKNMLNERGSALQETMSAGMQTATSLVKNHETVGKVLVGVIATYGTYKAAVMAVTAAENLCHQATLAQMAGMTKKQAIIDVLRAKTAALNKTMLANPYVLVSTAVVALGMALWSMHDSATALQKAQKEFNDELEKSKQKKEDLKNKVNELINKIQDETQTIYAQINAYKELKELLPKVFGDMSMEQVKALSPEDLSKTINSYLDKKDIADVRKSYEEQLKVVQKLKEAQQNWAPSNMYDRINPYIKSLEKAEEKLKLIKQEVDKVNAAEFESQPLENKIAYYETEIEKLNTQKRQLNTLLLGQKDITGEWGQINWQTQQNVAQLEFVNKKLNEMKGNLSTLQNVPANANYGVLYDEAKKNWDTAKKTLATIAKDRSKYAKEDYDKAKTDEASAKKAFADLGGNVTASKSGMSDEEKANVLKAEQKVRERQIQDYTASLVVQQRQSEFDIRQARIDAMKEGIEKEKEAIRLNYDKLIEENRQREQKWIKDLQTKTNLEYENENPDWKKKGLSGPAQNTVADLTDEQTRQLKDYTDSANLYQESASKELIKGLIEKYQDYADQRKAIEAKFNADLAAMYDENGNLLNGFTQANVDELTRQWTEALAALDNEFSRTKTSIEMLFDDMSKKSASDMRAIADQAQAMMDFVTGGNWDAGKAEMFGIKTEAQFKQLNAEWAKSPEKLAAIKKAIEQLNNSANQSEMAFKKMSAGLKMAFSVGGQDELEGGLTMIADGLKSVTEMGGLFADSLRNIGELSGSDMFTQLADGLSSVMDVANSTMQGAQAGAAFGPVGAAVGAALGFVSSITNALAAGKAQAEKNAKLTTEMIRLQYVGEKEVNRLYRERYDWSQRVGETNLEYVRRVGEELKKQRAEAEKDTSDYWRKLQDSQYYSYWDTGKRSNWLGDWAVKDVDAHWAGETSLSGKSEKEIDELYHQGRLTDEAKAWYELWLKAKEERNDLLQKEEEELERIRELTTGSSYNAVANSIIEGFKAGKRSAADFADSFEQLMQNAVLSALSLKTDGAMRQWYEDFAAMGEGGYTKEEIDEARKRYMAYLEQLAIDAEALKQVTGVDFSSKNQTGKAGAYEAASQESVTRLEGLYSSMLEHEISIDGGVENIAEGMSAALTHLQQIEENTAFCRRLTDIADDINAIKRDGIRTR